jgi:hypothetical protein
MDGVLRKIALLVTPEKRRRSGRNGWGPRGREGRASLCYDTPRWGGGNYMRLGFRLRRLAILLALATLPASAYEYPLSSTIISEAYVLGTSTLRAGGCVAAAYGHALPEFKAGAYVSAVRIETPYVQIAEHACQAVNYTAQDAEAQFLSNPPTVFRMQLDICFGYEQSQSVKFRIIQNDRELAPNSFERSPYFERGRYGPSKLIGEHLKLQFEADKIESAPLTVEIETPDGQHATTIFDLAKLR